MASMHTEFCMTIITSFCPAAISEIKSNMPMTLLLLLKLLTDFYSAPYSSASKTDKQIDIHSKMCITISD